jgi:hypothetical protein
LKCCEGTVVDVVIGYTEDGSPFLKEIV